MNRETGPSYKHQQRLSQKAILETPILLARSDGIMIGINRFPRAIHGSEKFEGCKCGESCHSHLSLPGVGRLFRDGPCAHGRHTVES
jgi:hypothetical protein